MTCERPDPTAKIPAAIERSASASELDRRSATGVSENEHVRPGRRLRNAELRANLGERKFQHLFVIGLDVPVALETALDRRGEEFGGAGLGQDPGGGFDSGEGQHSDLEEQERCQE